MVHPLRPHRFAISGRLRSDGNRSEQSDPLGFPDRIQNYDFDFNPFQLIIMNFYYLLKKIGISDIKAMGLDSSITKRETVPLISNKKSNVKLRKTVPQVPLSE